MTKIQLFPPDILEGVGQVLGETERGLTGREIGSLLAQCNIRDVDSTATKRIRIFHALLDSQNRSQVGNGLVALINAAMAPSRYREDAASEAWRRDALNEVLVHEGLKVSERGRVTRRKDGKATTRNEAASRAGTLRTELQRRGTHPDVLRYCTDEILMKNNFHALLEAAKSVPDRLRLMSSLGIDGAQLADATLFPKADPLIAINSLSDDTDLSEQGGFGNLVKGLLGMYRNPTAHTPKINRDVGTEELLEAFAVFSMVHHRLDGARLRPSA